MKLFGAAHVRFVKHLSASFSSGVKRLKGSNFKNFMNRLNKVATEDFTSETNSEQHLDNRIIGL
eukprot:snap_masked-scaffold_5-processed-gene-8.54-mRNA-1 protein AED:1.00 eAED:1.00 QI:0/-1/0/0/-1/1/1/0/63